MASIVENLVQYDMSADEAERLVQMGLITPAEDAVDVFETTAIVWDDLNLGDDRCFILFDLILGKGDTYDESEVPGRAHRA